MSSDDQAAFAQQYEEVCKSYHAIEDFRAKMLALLPFGSGAGGLILIANKETVQDYLIQIGLFGALVTVGLYIFEARGAQRCRHLKCVASALEQRLGLDNTTAQFLAEPKPFLGFVREGVAGVIVYLVVVVGWLLLAVQARGG